MLFIKHIFQALRPLSLSLSLEEAAETLVLHLLLTVSWASGRNGLIASLAKGEK